MLGNRGRGRARVEYTHCKECQLPFDDVGVKASSGDRRMCNTCNSKIRSSLNRWRKLNPEPADGLCPGCGREPKYGHGFDVDHCHITGVIRDYLCHGCNVCVAMADDDPNTLLSLALRTGKHKTEHGLPF
jgi:MinD superfamily P-loop ATPase